ncbi:GNAT family N-acetyltransferase [Psychrobacter sp. B38]|uniref:GNAT family N-acetyltransferase n=1 Tax=Psychrobacter sp. B38 TaxID=3143538 RepID=UPI00320F2F34
MRADPIMCLYEKYERKAQFEELNVQRVADENIIKYIYKGSRPAFISYFEPVSLSINKLIESEVAYFTNINQPFEWKVYGTDLPTDIGKRLLATGFVEEETPSLLVCDIGNYQIDLTTPDEVECKKAISKQMFREYLEIQSTEFPLDIDEEVNQHWTKYENDKNCTIYVVYRQGKPVASARINFTPDSIFAGIWAGTTLKEYTGKGYYQILLNYRIDEAKQRGRQYIAIDALPTSRPIVEKHGFKFITSITTYIYRP